MVTLALLELSLIGVGVFGVKQGRMVMGMGQVNSPYYCLYGVDTVSAYQP